MGLMAASVQTEAAAAEATQGLQPADKPRCESIQGLSGAGKAVVLMEIQPGPAALRDLQAST